MKIRYAILGLFLAAPMLAACAEAPYVYKAEEYDRSSEYFASEPDDISDVIICYSSSNATPAQVLELAQARCAQYGKTARFETQDYLSCPLSTPVSARFFCEIPAQSGYSY